MHLHLLHFIRIKLLLDPLRQRRREAVTRSGLAAAVIHVWGERVIYGEVRSKGETLGGGGSSSVGKGGRSGVDGGESGGGGVEGGEVEQAVWGRVGRGSGLRAGGGAVGGCCAGDVFECKGRDKDVIVVNDSRAVGCVGPGVWMETVNMVRIWGGNTR